MRSITDTPQLSYLLNPLLRRSLGEARLDLVSQVHELIDQLLAEGATLEQVATRLQMPARRLREQLSQANVRFNDMVNDRRSQLAKRLLLETDERIELIAERTGFSEPSTFYRAFKRWVGETPVEFRRRGRLQAAERGPV
ncbi:AraC-like DNA-binding protein [Pseudomonas sp. BIGb0408]|uniref:AraC-like DNA-binding protein n=1 Tax=Phytopseudomonas flavescens TaxID=29435 RepID=A0A7Z0BS84_9GAMM|nr:AraC-like DNA-binding protein [Pseudomonas sp. BIGb0408]NYH75023.1 AraC-like DNA-binding protein [Pseudomonas flavescens]